MDSNVMDKEKHLDKPIKAFKSNQEESQNNSRNTSAKKIKGAHEGAEDFDNLEGLVGRDEEYKGSPEARNTHSALKQEMDLSDSKISGQGRMPDSTENSM